MLQSTAEAHLFAQSLYKQDFRVCKVTHNFVKAVLPLCNARNARWQFFGKTESHVSWFQETRLLCRLGILNCSCFLKWNKLHVESYVCCIRSKLQNLFWMIDWYFTWCFVIHYNPLYSQFEVYSCIEQVWTLLLNLCFRLNICKLTVLLIDRFPSVPKL